MLSKSTLLHLRIPFSFFLMPVFCFAVAIAQSENYFDVFLIFFIIHFLLYPASNGYNSYYDKDEDSIGGLENPPPVSKELFYTAWALDILAILLSFLIGLWFVLAIFIYGLVSKAYSHDKIRLKKFPILSWLVIGFFQGAFTFWMVYQGSTHQPLSIIGVEKVLYAGILSSWLLWGSYPMTQVYQHAEDARRGDLTLSRMLGIRGTFIFTLLVFSSSGIGYGLYFWYFFGVWYSLTFGICLLPVVIYFLSWAFRVWQNENQADFKSTMRLNLISAICMNLFFVGLGVFQ